MATDPRDAFDACFRRSEALARRANGFSALSLVLIVAAIPAAILFDSVGPFWACMAPGLAVLSWSLWLSRAAARVWRSRIKIDG